ncbi:MAG: 3'-5' exonuclease [Fibrobacterota bacterium]|nr:MAG: 3'-5' exonuclease [Fibrobacterota bacterium]
MSTLPANVSALVLDIETIVDGRLIQRVKWPAEPELSPVAARRRLTAELREASDGKSDFIPHVFHVPVSTALAGVDEHFRLVGLTTLDRPQFRPQIIARHFWDGWEKRKRPQLVTFNGRGFDMPVLEMAAFRYGIPLPGWFGIDGPTSPRARFQQRGHLDLMELVTAHGAVRLMGGLHLLATLLQKPGKMDTKGSMVQDLWDEGQKLRIDDYCLCDVLDTYFVHLRLAVLRGKVRAEDEHQIVTEARQLIEENVAEYPGLGEYLEKFRYWVAPDGEDDGML